MTSRMGMLSDDAIEVYKENIVHILRWIKVKLQRHQLGLKS